MKKRRKTPFGQACVVIGFALHIDVLLPMMMVMMVLLLVSKAMRAVHAIIAVY
jgi:hypothetical protein